MVVISKHTQSFLLKVIGASAAVAMSAQMAHAGGFYASVGVGGSVSDSTVKYSGTNSVGTPAFELGNSAVSSIGLGYKINNNWSIEGDLRYRQAKASDAITMPIRPQNAYIGSTTETYDAQTKVRSTSLMVNAVYNVTLPQTAKLTPYIKAGVGVAHHNTSFHQYISPDFAFWGAPAEGVDYPRKTKTNIAWSLGTGVSYAITNKVDLTLDYQYINMGKAVTGADDRGDSVVIKPVRAHEMTAGLRYSF